MKNNNEIQIQFVPIELLEYNEGQIPGVPENPRTREDAKQRNLEKSIEELPEMTIARAALCFPYNGRYVVIGGNRRLEAQRALKRKEVPIIALPEDTPVDKLRRIALLDNESTGQTDWAKLAKDWSKDEIRAWNIETPKGWFNEAPGKKAEEDNYTEPEKLKPRVKAGEIWQLGEHRLMCGDSTNKDDVARLMNGTVADLVFTDPPYQLETKGGCKGEIGKALEKQGADIEFISDFNPESFLKTLLYVFKKNTINAYIFCNKNLLPNYLNFAVKNKISYNVLVWKKPNAIPIGDSHRPDIEYLVLFRKNAIWNNSLPNVNYSRCLEYSRETGLHPTMKPISLIGNELKISSNENSIVFDFFGGSGSTLIACEQLNRKCYMMELTEHYCDVIINRWETLTGRKNRMIWQSTINRR